jgi:SAM-dependent methyltransferase
VTSIAHYQESNRELIAIAPCLAESPIADAGRRTVYRADALGDSPWAARLRAWCVRVLFDGMERAFAGSAHPTSAIIDLLERLSAFLRVAGETGDDRPDATPVHGAAPLGEAMADATGEHYGQLFKAFSTTSFWDEPVHLLRTRLERNGIELPELHEMDVLDSGCGGGRYTVAWRLLGAGSATGIDISSTGIADASARVIEAGIEGVSFMHGTVLDLPFEDNSFDIVFSNGVLHHTTDWQQGVRELMRVLRPAGFGWLYVIERPGGLFWDVIEVLRAIMRRESREAARNALRTLRIPSNRIFYMLDHVMVPINLRLTPREVEATLAASGASDVRRLNRGTDFDRIERIYQGDPFATVKYGVAENRYTFSKA